jgi:hypothetical protein
MAHAFLSPSGAAAWLRCNAKPWREKDLPDTSNEAADEGTAAHFLLEQCLDKNVDADHFTGQSIKVEDGKTEFHTHGAYAVGPDMTREIQKVLDVARANADGATIYAEQELRIEQFTGEEGATGTCDMVIVKGKTLWIRDLKYGRGVQVFAEGNEQLLLYGGAALDEFDVMGEIETLVLCIDQPRLSHFDTWTISVADARCLLEAIKLTAIYILEAPEELTAVPGDKQCKFCKASATCPERTDFTMELITETFVDLDKGFVKVEMPQAEKLLAQSFGVTPKAISFNETESREDGAYFLAHFTVKKPSIRPSLEEATDALATADDERLATLMDAADMIEGFAKAVRAEVERRLLAGKFTDARYKLVEGRQGARSWTSEEEAEATLKAMRLKVDQMYDFKLISPTTAEKVLKEANPRKWTKLQPLIGRSDGKPSVAPASDKRPALSMAIAEQFEELPAEVETLMNAELAHADLAAEQETVVEDNFDDLV